jgi:hypothetical protein
MCSIDRNARLSRRIARTGIGICGGSLSIALLAGCGSGGGIKGTTVAPTTLAEYTTNIGLTDSDTTVYTDTYSRLFSPDPYGQSITNQTQSFTDTGSQALASNLIPDGGASLGTPVTTTITLPNSGKVSVTKQALLDPLGNVEGYEYYSLNSSGEVYYGDDTLSRGALSMTTRYDPGILYPYDLKVGQVQTQTYTDYEDTYSATSGNVSNSYSFPITSSTTFTAVLPTYTVTAGTYTNVAEVQYFSSATIPAGSIGNTNVEAITDTATFHLSSYVGVIEDQDVTTTANERIVPTVTGQSPYTTTQTDSHDEVLTSATIAGTTYPPGRAASASGGVGTIRIGHLLHQLRNRSQGSLQHVAVARKTAP